jgi:hypothetical protein
MAAMDRKRTLAANVRNGWKADIRMTHFWHSLPQDVSNVMWSPAGRRRQHARRRQTRHSCSIAGPGPQWVESGHWLPQCVRTGSRIILTVRTHERRVCSEARLVPAKQPAQCSKFRAPRRRDFDQCLMDSAAFPAALRLKSRTRVVLPANFRACSDFRGRVVRSRLSAPPATVQVRER